MSRLVGRRRSLKAAGLLGVATLLAACSKNESNAMQGWETTEVDGLSFLVRSDWTRGDVEGQVWTGRWDSEDGQNRLLVASDLEADDAYAAIEIAMDAARSATRGYAPVGTRTAERVGDLLVVRQDYRTSWPLNGDGTVWCVSSGNRHALVDLSGADVSAEERDGVGASFSVSESFAQEASAVATSAAPQDAPEGTALLERSGVRLAVPEGWYDTDGIEGSERWTVGWAMIDDDEIIQARLLVAPSMPQESVSLALAQIEVDHQAGSLDGYTMRSRTPLTLAGMTEAVRTDFVSGDAGEDQGCLWVFTDGTTVAAVQYNCVGQLDTSVRDAVENTLAFVTV
ncbi:hypothetical protein [Actinomyces ruminis]|nr:hypothetical protein [Actinomyces ruminis]